VWRLIIFAAQIVLRKAFLQKKGVP